MHSSSVYKRILWITDLGLDTVEAYRLNEAGGLAASSPFLRFELPEGSGREVWLSAKTESLFPVSFPTRSLCWNGSGRSSLCCRKYPRFRRPGTTVPIGIQRRKTMWAVSRSLRMENTSMRATEDMTASPFFAVVERDGMIPVQWAPAGGRQSQRLQPFSVRKVAPCGRPRQRQPDRDETG